MHGSKQNFLLDIRLAKVEQSEDNRKAEGISK